MIELRWYTPSPMTFVDTMGMERHANGITTLQFRHRVHPDAGTVYENGNAYTEWQDVPSVSGP